MSKVFNSKYPILEACMNKGSSLELAVAVHRAGGYPSFCSWTYNRRFDAMQKEIDQFVAMTGSNCVHLSFELDELPDFDTCHRIVKSHDIPTIEIIYGASDSYRGVKSRYTDVNQAVQDWVGPLHEHGTRIFKRLYEPIDAATMKNNFIDGFCIKGLESAGFGGYTPVKELFLKQQELTPAAMLIPYGGVSTAAQVKDYMGLGAEIVAVGTVLALSTESTIKLETKLAAINATKSDLVEFEHNTGAPRKQTALEFEPYTGSDDFNRTKGLVKGMWKKNSNQGHVYLGHGIDNVNALLSCEQIIQNLTADLLSQ